jgi:hypothetical protein
MSMIYCLQQASDDTLRKLQERPELIILFLTGQPTWAPRPRGLVARLFLGPTPPPPKPVEEVRFEKSDEVCDLDKAWHGLHFLFTGSDWEGDPPASFLLNWGDTVGDVDVGYGPARTLTSEQVREIAAYLADTAEAQLRSRFDQQRMIDLAIYPDIWNRDLDDDDTLGYLMHYYAALQKYVAETADRGWGLVVWIG